MATHTHRNPSQLPVLKTLWQITAIHMRGASTGTMMITMMTTTMVTRAAEMLTCGACSSTLRLMSCRRSSCLESVLLTTLTSKPHGKLIVYESIINSYHYRTNYADPVATILSVIIITYGAWPLTRDCAWILLQSSPSDIPK